MKFGMKTPEYAKLILSGIFWVFEGSRPTHGQDSTYQRAILRDYTFVLCSNLSQRGTDIWTRRLKSRRRLLSAIKMYRARYLPGKNMEPSSVNSLKL